MCEACALLCTTGSHFDLCAVGSDHTLQEQGALVFRLVVGGGHNLLSIGMTADRQRGSRSWGWALRPHSWRVRAV